MSKYIRIRGISEVILSRFYSCGQVSHADVVLQHVSFRLLRILIEWRRAGLSLSLSAAIAFVGHGSLAESADACARAGQDLSELRRRQPQRLWRGSAASVREGGLVVARNLMLPLVKLDR
eukprot:2802529-Amphidinium_carterae.1